MARSTALDLPPLCVLTAPGRSPAQAARDALELLEAGLPWVQLRIKESSDRDLLAACRWLVERVSTRSWLTLDDRVDVALAAGVRAVHLGDRDLPAAAARVLLGPDCVIGTSSHRWDQAQELARGPVDYVALGPIFSSRTKSGHSPVVGTGEIERAVGAGLERPLVAIGGVDRAGLGAVFRAGATAVAVVDAVWSTASPVSSALGLLESALSHRAGRAS